jgi:mono/diheme cytochrome c family protein
MRRTVILLAGILFAATVAGEAINNARAKFNYQMLCQGCHTPDGAGGKGVPRMKDFVGNFLSSEQGRAYLVQVPGSANAALDDAQLAEVLNWIIIEMGGSSVPENMRFYTAEEVGELRKDPLFEVLDYRRQLLAEIGAE